MAAFTFKREPRQTGLAAVGNPYANVAIKHDKKEVGIIYAPNWMTKDGKWSICFAVNREGSWKWVTVKQKFDDEDAARLWVKENAARILTLGLHYLEN